MATNGFAYVPAGTIVTCNELQYHQNNKITSLTLDRKTKVWFEKDDSIIVEFPRNIKGSLTIPNNTKLEIIKYPAITKEFKAQAVKKSVWEFTEDWHYDGDVEWPSGSGDYFAPKGTQITVVDSKLRMHGANNRCLVIKPVEPFASLARVKYYSNDEMVVYLPANEISHILKLVTPGKTKTYWLFLNGRNEKIVDKRFASLAAIKSSARLRLGLVPDSPDVPDYLYSSDVKKFDDWVAVEYDYVSNVEIKREDLMLWCLEQKLKHK